MRSDSWIYFANTLPMNQLYGDLAQEQDLFQSDVRFDVAWSSNVAGQNTKGFILPFLKTIWWRNGLSSQQSWKRFGIGLLHLLGSRHFILFKVTVYHVWFVITCCHILSGHRIYIKILSRLVCVRVLCGTCASAWSIQTVETTWLDAPVFSQGRMLAMRVQPWSDHESHPDLAELD